MRRRIGSFAERAIESAGKLCRVRQDGNVLIAGFIQRSADSGDATVHHVRRRDDVHPRLGLCDRGPGQQLQRGVVEDLVLFGRNSGNTGGGGYGRAQRLRARHDNGFAQ